MGVTFDEKAHKYTSTSGEEYISVTTLIKRYVPPFDSHYWSTYKAVKEVMIRKGEWATYKANCGGWENVVAFVRMDKKFPYRTEVMEVKQRLLKEWADNARDSAAKGTAFHKKKEASDRSDGLTTYRGKQHAVHSGDPLKARGFDDREGLFPELLIYDDELKVAGTSDWVLRESGVVHIKDYKTSKTIDKMGFMDTTLLHPVNDVLNANFYVYTLQLSLYAYMLERKGYTIGDLSLDHIDKETHKLIDNYPTVYYKDQIIKLLDDWISNGRPR